jgi:branched-chain amino acid transport system permease protein
VIAALPFTWANLQQVVVNGVLIGTNYALTAVGFGLIITVTGRFHIAYGAIYALSAFIAGQVAISWGLPYAAALLVGLASGAIVAVAIERFLYWPLNRRLGAAALITIFIVSLGLSTAGQNAIALLWVDSGTLNVQGFHVDSVNFGDVYTTNLAITAFVCGWVALLAVWAVIRWTKLGRMIRAVRVNPELSLAIGIDPKVVYMSVFAMGTALGAIGAVFTATQSTATPDMGTTPILYAITISFLASSSSPMVIAAVAIVVGLVQSLSGFFVQPEWAQVVVFAGLLLYVLLKVAQANVDSSGRRRRATTPNPSGEALRAAPTIE